jgi:hypothetical protein
MERVGSEQAWCGVAGNHAVRLFLTEMVPGSSFSPKAKRTRVTVALVTRPERPPQDAVYPKRYGGAALQNTQENPLMREDVVTLAPIIRAAARKSAPFDQDLQADLEQDGWVAALEASQRFRGTQSDSPNAKGAATLATYAYNAIRLAIYNSKVSAETPVHVPRHAAKQAWGFKRKNPAHMTPNWESDFAPADHMDTLAGEPNGHNIEELQLARIVHKHIAESQFPDAVCEVLLGDSAVSEVAEKFGIGTDTLRRAANRTCDAIKRDKALAGVYNGALVKASEAAKVLGIALNDLKELCSSKELESEYVNSCLMISKAALVLRFKDEPMRCAALARM